MQGQTRLPQLVYVSAVILGHLRGGFTRLLGAIQRLPLPLLVKGSFDGCTGFVGVPRNFLPGLCDDALAVGRSRCVDQHAMQVGVPSGWQV